MTKQTVRTLHGIIVLLTASILSSTVVLASDADRLYADQQWSAAAAAYRSELAEHPDNARAWYRLGVALQQQKSYQQSVDALMKAVDLGASLPHANYQLSVGMAGLGHNKAALERLSAAAQAGFSDPDAPSTAVEFASISKNGDFKNTVAKIQRNSAPCVHDSEHSLFDFWLGDWTVVDDDGQVVGQNKIYKAQQDCVIVEEWISSGGFTGQSINYFHPGLGKWTQKWISPGSIIDISGNWDGKKLLLSGEIFYFANGTSAPFRGAWTPHNDGRVEQHFEQSDDGGLTWKTWFRGWYNRTK